MENQYIVINLLLKNVWMISYGKLYNVIEKLHPPTRSLCCLGVHQAVPESWKQTRKGSLSLVWRLCSQNVCFFTCTNGIFPNRSTIYRIHILINCMTLSTYPYKHDIQPYLYSKMVTKILNQHDPPDFQVLIFSCNKRYNLLIQQKNRNLMVVESNSFPCLVPMWL